MRRFLSRPTALVVLVCAALVVLFAGIAQSDGGPPSGPRPAPVIHFPPGWSHARRAPLVIALHASGGTPAGFEAKSGWDQVANQHGFVVAYLGSAAPAWKDPSNVAYIGSEIDRLESGYNIDPRRVYVTGFSAGAYGTYFAGCGLSSKVAAIAPVSGVMAPQSCHLSRPVAELTIFGTRDLIPLTGNSLFPAPASVTALWRSLDGCPAQAAKKSQAGPVLQRRWGSCADGTAVGFYIINGGHHVYPGWAGLPSNDPDAQFKASQAIWAFFAAHQAGSLTRPSASLLRLRVRGTRALVATLSVQEAVSVQTAISAGGRTIASKGSSSGGRRGRFSLVLHVPAASTPGLYTVRLTIRDAYGRRLTLRRSITLP
jgi:polyhydroxybutyrate depolymerase